MLPSLPTRRRPRCRSTSCLLCIGLVALYHSLLAGLLMHFWVASSAGLQHENLELAGRVSELSGRVAALQQVSAERQLRERAVDSLQVAPKPARKPAPAPQAHTVLPASAPPADRCGREESGPPPPDPKLVAAEAAISALFTAQRREDLPLEMVREAAGLPGDELDKLLKKMDDENKLMCRAGSVYLI